MACSMRPYDHVVRQDVTRLYGVAASDVELIDHDVVAHALPVVRTPLDPHQIPTDEQHHHGG